MKKLVLDYESREEVNEKQGKVPSILILDSVADSWHLALINTLANRGINLKFTKQTPP